MTSSADPATGLVGFEALDARIRSAVEAVAATDPNPADPFRGLYISDELAARARARGPRQRARRPARPGRAAARPERTRGRGAGALRRARSSARTTGASTPTSTTTSPGSSRARGSIARLLVGHGHLACAGDRLLRPRGTASTDAERCGCSRRAASCRSPTACSRSPTGSRRTSSQRGSTSRRATGGCARCRCPSTTRAGRPRWSRFGRSSPRGRQLPLLVAGPDAPSLLAVAVDRPLLVVDVVDVTDAELMRDATLSALLEERLLCFDGLDELEPDKHVKVQRALARTR